LPTSSRLSISSRRRRKPNSLPRNPADAVGLHDRGRIVEGARADLVLVDTVETPTVSRAFVDGEQVYWTGDRR